MRALPQRGFTLIELMIALVILGFLTMLAVPMYGEMLTNSQIRNAAENILTGMRTAQAEAIHLNAPAKFVLSNGTGWRVYVTDPDTNDYAVAPWRQYNFSEGASRATVTTTAGSEVVFNGLGQIVKTVDTIPQVDITGASANPHVLRILVGTETMAAGMKMCDPGYASTDPVGCPAL
ncbi:MAG: GspH/FimT family pseudopilin [Casimicrobiaceae bacterium]